MPHKHFVRDWPTGWKVENPLKSWERGLKKIRQGEATYSGKKVGAPQEEEPNRDWARQWVLDNMEEIRGIARRESSQLTKRYLNVAQEYLSLASENMRRWE